MHPAGYTRAEDDYMGSHLRHCKALTGDAASVLPEVIVVLLFVSLVGWVNTVSERIYVYSCHLFQ